MQISSLSSLLKNKYGIFGGLSLITGIFKLLGVIGLSVFLVVATLTIHRFWSEREREMQLLEAMNFAKNMAIVTELIYIAAG